MAKKKQPVQYKDTKGNTWEATPGEPDGTFMIPGSQLRFSLMGFAQWAERNLPVAKIITEDGIVDAGEVTFDDGLALTGSKAPKANGHKKKGSTSSGKGDLVMKLFSRKATRMTKRQIREETGVSNFVINRLIGEGKIQPTGKKEGNAPLYGKA